MKLAFRTTDGPDPAGASVGVCRPCLSLWFNSEGLRLSGREMCDWVSYFLDPISSAENRVQMCTSPAIPGLDPCTKRNNAWSM